MSSAAAAHDDIVIRTCEDVDAYVQAVLDEKIVVGELVRLAVYRHLRDLERAQNDPDCPFYFDAERADARLAFNVELVHVKGELSGLPFVPEVWQCFIQASLHGWRLKEDGRRRFTTAYVQVAKKNGKTFMGASEGLFGLALDGEDGAEVYSIATKEEQAALSWKPAQTMVERSTELQGMLSTSSKSIYDKETASFWRPLGSDSKKQDGMNPSLLLVDELHAHPNGDLYNNMRYSMAARLQPLTFIMTTAGAGRTSFCYSIRQKCEKVLRGLEGFEDDTLFAFIAEPDEGDDWLSDAYLRKANPNLGVSVKLAFLLAERVDAQQNPRKENDFRRYHGNEWTEQAVRWIPMTEWDQCTELEGTGIQEAAAWRQRMLEELRGKPCFAGIDLARTTDLTALALVFRTYGVDDKWVVLPWFWIPESKVKDDGEGDHVPYRVWAKHGFVTIHNGNVLDGELLENDIATIAKQYAVLEAPYDPNCGGTDIAIRLGNRGVKVVEFAPTWKNVTPAAKKFEELVLAHKVEHGANPVLRWNAANVVALVGPTDTIRPAKPDAQGRIDGVVATIYAIGRAMVAPPRTAAKVTVI